MKYSFVICTYNRAKHLAKTIESVCLLDFSKKGYEIIVIDNNSNDDTSDAVKKSQQRFSEWTIIYFMEREQGISYARNKGVKVANGEYIIFLDDDETINTNYLKVLEKHLEKHLQIRFAATALEPVYETKKPKWLSHYTMRLVTGYYNMGEEVIQVGFNKYPGTGHTIIKKELFEQFGYYNTDLGRKGNSLMGAEDKDMSQRLIANNIECYYLPNMPIYHHIPDSKLTNKHFNKLTYSIGKSEKIRTQSISKKTYQKRLFSECIKWAASIILFLGYTLTFRPRKGWKLIQFRWNVSKGLLGY